MSKRLVVFCLAVTALVAPAFAQAPPPLAVYDVVDGAETAVAAGTEHVFQGEAVADNGMIRLSVSPKNGVGLFAYGADRVAVKRAELAFFGDELKPSGAPVETALAELTRSGSTIEVRFAHMKVALKLKRGEITVEAVPLENVDTMRIVSRPELIVVPAFLGDDLLFTPENLDPGKYFLPSENLLLELHDGGNGMLQLVWPEGEQEIRVETAAQDAGHAIRATEIKLDSKSAFVAAWTSPGVWQKIPVDAAFRENGRTKDVALPRKAPFAAKYRAIFHNREIDTTWTMNARRTEGKIGPHGREIFYTWPFWRQAGGFMLHHPPLEIQRTAAEYVIVYPLEREAGTPREVQLPDDVLRQALKTGVCDYLLNQEGRGNPGGPLCVLIRRYEMLARTYAHGARPSNYLATHVNWILEQGEWQYQRVNEYMKFADDVIAAVDDALKDHPELEKHVVPLRENAANIRTHCLEIFETGTAPVADFRDYRPASDDPVAAMREIADTLKTSLRTPHPENLPEWLDLAKKLHKLAVRPQSQLPTPRRLTRMIQNDATRISFVGPAAAQMAAKIRALARGALKGMHWAEQER